MKKAKSLAPFLCLFFWAEQAMAVQSDPRLIGHWKMDEAVGVMAVSDSSGSGRTLTFGPGCSLESSRFGNALRFNGAANAYASFSFSKLTNLTFAAWVRQDGMGNVLSNFYPRFFQVSNWYYHLGITNVSQGTGFTYGYSGTGWSSNGNTPLRVFPGKWAHAAVVYQTLYTSATVRVSWPTFFINGIRCGTSQAVKTIANDIDAGVCYVGNTGANGTRPLDGLLDEVRLYNAALTDKEILALYYNSRPAVSAGQGQIGYRPETTLQGRLMNNNPFMRDLSAVTLWSVASAPAGATPLLRNADVPSASATLPVAGDYVFRLIAEGRFGSATSEVAITRLEGVPTGHAAPAVTMPLTATNCVMPTSVTVAAEVSDDNMPGPVRVRWSKVSGPGGVFFDNPFTNSTDACFSTNGVYVLRLTADDGDKESTNEMTVTVAPQSVNLSDGLIHGWTLDNDPGVKTAYDSVGSNTLTLINEAVLQPGKSGYGLRSPHANAAGRAATILTNAECMSYAVWFYYDNAYTNNPYMRLFNNNQNYLYYRLSDNVLLLETVDMKGVQRNWSHIGTPLTSNRWFHAAVLFDRRPAATGMQQTFYLNGIRQGSTSLPVAFAGATNMISVQFVGGNGGLRNFDGVVDDARIYNRFLTDEEVRTLAVDPDNNRSPVIEVSQTSLTGYAGRMIAWEAKVFDDGRPEGSSLVCRWEVVSGDPTGLTFGDRSHAATTLTLDKSGDYVLRLTASDGEQFSASEHVALKVAPGGTLVNLR